MRASKFNGRVRVRASEFNGRVPRCGIFSRPFFPAFWGPLFPCLFPFSPLQSSLLYLYFVISLLPSCFMFGMPVIRRLLGILTFLRVLLLTQLFRTFNFEFAVTLLIMISISGLLIVFFVKLVLETRLLFCLNFISIFFFFSARSP